MNRAKKREKKEKKKKEKKRNEKTSCSRSLPPNCYYQMEQAPSSRSSLVPIPNNTTLWEHPHDFSCLTAMMGFKTIKARERQHPFGSHYFHTK